MQLLVLDELQWIGRDWSSFLFFNCFELETLTRARNPKAKRVPSPPASKPSQPLVTKPKEPTRVKPRNKTEKRPDQMQMLDTPTLPPAKQKSKVVKDAKQEQAVSKQGAKRITRSQAMVLKGKKIGRAHV